MAGETQKFPGFTGGFDDFLDEDTLSSDSATAVPSQQSVKAYVDGASTYPKVVYSDGPATLSANTVYTYTHNLGTTSAEMQSGKWKVVLTGSRGGFGYQFGDVYAEGFWGGSTRVAVRHQFTSSDPTSQGNVNWQANTLKIDIGATELTLCRLHIIQMF